VIFHCFSGDAAMARECVDAGYVLSFAGTVTFRNAHDLRDAAALVPEDPGWCGGAPYWVAAIL